MESKQTQLDTHDTHVTTSALIKSSLDNNIICKYKSDTNTLIIRAKNTKQVIINPKHLFGWSDDDPTKIKHLVFANNVTISGNAAGLLQNLTSLEKIIGLKYLKTTNANNLSNFFLGDSSLKVIDISTFDISNVTSMAKMFADCTSLNILNINKLAINHHIDTTDMLKNLTSLAVFEVDSDTHLAANMALNTPGTWTWPVQMSFSQPIDSVGLLTSYKTGNGSTTLVNQSVAASDKLWITPKTTEGDCYVHYELNGVDTELTPKQEAKQSFTLSYYQVYQYDDHNLDNKPKLLWTTRGQLFDHNLSTIKVPVVKGYTTNWSEVKKRDLCKYIDHNITPSKSIHIDLKIVYQPLGHIIPITSNNQKITSVELLTYENDKNDATKVIPITLPSIEGYLPAVKEVRPINPAKNTRAVYFKNNKTILNFLDQENNGQPITTVKHIITNNPLGQAITKPDSVLTALTAAGYVLVTNPLAITVKATEGIQTLNYIFKHDHKITTEYEQRYQTIHYVDIKHKALRADDVQNVTFSRQVTEDLVTHQLSYSKWNSLQSKTKTVRVPVIKGYIANQSLITEQTLSFESSDINKTVVYQKLGSYVLVDKNGQQIKDSIPYLNDETDATKIKPLLVAPKVTNYVSPNVSEPTDITKDTTVIYANKKSSLEIVIHDNIANKDLTEYHWKSGIVNAGSRISYDWPKIKQELEYLNYVIVDKPNLPDRYPESEQVITIHVVPRNKLVAKHVSDDALKYPTGIINHGLKETIGNVDQNLSFDLPISKVKSEMPTLAIDQQLPQSKRNTSENLAIVALTLGLVGATKQNN